MELSRLLLQIKMTRTDKQKEASKKYFQDNKDLYAERNRQWRMLNPTKFCECCNKNLERSSFAEHTRTKIHRSNFLKLVSDKTLS